jgi:hypothetical protein
MSIKLTRSLPEAQNASAFSGTDLPHIGNYTGVISRLTAATKPPEIDMNLELDRQSTKDLNDVSSGCESHDHMLTVIFVKDPMSSREVCTFNHGKKEIRETLFEVRQFLLGKFDRKSAVIHRELNFSGSSCTITQQ